MNYMNFSPFKIILFTLLFTFLASSTVYSAELKKDIKFIDLDGNESMLSDYKGKWVIVNLWATWCPPCLVEIPELIMFHEAHKDKDAIVIGVNYESISSKKLKAFVEEQMINFPIVRFAGEIDGVSTPFGPFRALPITYLIAPNGQLVFEKLGMVTQEILESFMQVFYKNSLLIPT